MINLDLSINATHQNIVLKKHRPLFTFPPDYKALMNFLVTAKQGLVFSILRIRQYCSCIWSESPPCFHDSLLIHIQIHFVTDENAKKC